MSNNPEQDSEQEGVVFFLSGKDFHAFVKMLAEQPADAPKLRAMLTDTED